MLKYILVIVCIAINISKVKCACELDEWDCDNGDCIKSTDVCDGKPECADGSDETAENCIHVQDCPDYAFRCVYGACVAGSAKCDNVTNCYDNSDELHALCNRQGNEIEYKGACNVDNENLCDGHADCPDGSDETLELCGAITCPSYAFQCGYGACISGNQKCNNIINCADESDEASMLCRKPRKRNNSNYCQLSTNRPNLIVKNAADEPLNATRVPDNSVILYTCPSGYNLVGTDGNYCEGSVWAKEIPECEKYCSNRNLTRGFSTVANCYYQHTPVDCEDFVRPGTVAMITCAPFYEQPLGGTHTWKMTCQDNGEWDNQKPNCNMKCGLVQPTVLPLSKGGTPVNITNVPWHVSIYSTPSQLYYNYICGGTIVAARLVISAAHCFWDVAQQKIYSPTFYIVVAGKYRKKYNEPQDLPPQYRNISEIIVPKNYNNELDNFKLDFALLVLEVHLDFNVAIRPICFLQESQGHEGIESDEKGFFAGWEIDNDRIERLHSVDMLTLSWKRCKSVLENIGTFDLPLDKFCLKSNFGYTACQGDSGGGFFQTKKSYGKDYYYLYGVISNAPKKSVSCAQSGIVVLTNLQIYGQMILDKIRIEQQIKDNYNDV